MRISLLSVVAVSTLLSLAAQAQDVPIAEWSGRIMLPPATSRLPDGAVLFKIENTPADQTALKGKTAWLRIDSTNANAAARFEAARVDVVFNQKAKTNAENDVMPTGIDGWKNVSPLESLAAGAAGNQIQAELHSPRIRVTDTSVELFIIDEPVVLDGSRQALIKFDKKIDNTTYLVRNYNPATKAFDGAQETMTVDFQKDVQGSFGETKTLDSIENHELNNGGWNVYGERTASGFVIKAIESYKLFQVRTAADFDQTFTPVTQPGLRSVYWNVSAADKMKIKKYAQLSSESALPKVGDEFLIAHGFGAWNQEGQMFGLVRGHASLGYAKVSQHPITGEPRMDIVYTQVYNQSSEGLFAAEFHQHAYSGNLYRGRMFIRPIADVALQLPQSLRGEITIDGEKTTVLQAIRHQINQMMRGYRTGFGHGYTQITLLTSCVHDSGNELIRALKKIKDAYASDAVASAALAPIAKALGNDVEIPAFMRDSDTAKTPETTPALLGLVAQNLNISIPRNLQEVLIGGFTAAGSPAVLSFTSVQTGADEKAYVPTAPSLVTPEIAMKLFAPASK
jgi:predicted Abi (CAAX) family protease